ncbi:helix-turn-helix domain-containing protein [uncultured Desulfosarcina sp.]|uniref:helix-turn-helix domain-containing protein n=1 Tax=uncultured Desulfosarcina sp. TaxID=218289 RepID=UPI0029C9608B|nr:helix-turn-helix domain-containing protein [uncultured Desulfosarcina sp.]
MKKLLTIGETAEALNCSVRTVHRLIENRELEAVKIRGCKRVTVTSVDLLIRLEIEKYDLSHGTYNYNSDHA